MLVPSRTLISTYHRLIISVAQEGSTEPVAFSSHVLVTYSISHVYLRRNRGFSFLLVSSSLVLVDASCYQVNCLMERPTWQETGGGVWPIANKELRPSVHQPVRHWTLIAATRVNLDKNPLLLGPWLAAAPLTPRSQPCERSWASDIRLGCTRIPHMKKLWDNEWLLWI